MHLARDEAPSSSKQRSEASGPFYKRSSVEEEEEEGARPHSIKFRRQASKQAGGATRELLTKLEVASI